MAEEQVRWRTRWDNSSLRKGVRNARRELKVLDDATVASAKRFASWGAAAAGAAVVAGSIKLVRVTREYEKLTAQLITATGSQQNAAVAWKAIKGLAAETPYDLQQVTDSFTKLVNLGLTPSRDALISYGNTASAMGKDLNQMIEAVADAATGEFERLKEFGIRASSEGDKVKFTFRGVTTEVQKNAADIEQYLMALGQNEFAGAMQQRMNTLDGAMSNLGDAWDQLFIQISKQGVGDAIEGGVREAIDVVEDFTDRIESGQLQAELEAWAGKFDVFANDMDKSMAAARGQYGTEMAAMAHATEVTVDFIGDAFRDMPENLNAAVKLLTVELASLVDHGQAYGTAFGEVLGIELAKIVDKAGAYGDELADMLNPFDGDTNDLEASLKRADSIAADMTDAAFKRAEQQAEASRQARRSGIQDIIAERDAAIQSYEDRLDAARGMREQWEQEQSKAPADLGQFNQANQDEDGSQAAAQRAQEEQEAFEKRLEKIQSRYETEAVLEQEHQQALADIKRGFDEGEIKSKEERDALIREMEKEHQNKLTKIETEAETRRRRFEQASLQQRVATVAGDLQKMTQAVAGENRRMFEINKAAALATATVEAIKGAETTWNAYPYPWNIPMTAAHVAASVARLSQISSQSFSSGGTAPSATSAGSGAAAGSQPVHQTGGDVIGGGGGQSNVTYLSGLDPNQLYEGRQIIDAIHQAQDNGAVLRVAS